MGIRFFFYLCILVIGFINVVITTEEDGYDHSSHKITKDNVLNEIKESVGMETINFQLSDLKMLIQKLQLKDCSSSVVEKCYQCISVENYYEWKGFDVAAMFDETQVMGMFRDFVFLLSQQNVGNSVVCKEFNKNVITSMDNITLHKLLNQNTTEAAKENFLHKLLKQLRDNFGYLLNMNEKCFTLDDILADLEIDKNGIKRNDLNFISSYIILKLLNKNCIELEEHHDNDNNDGFGKKVDDKYKTSNHNHQTIDNHENHDHDVHDDYEDLPRQSYFLTDLFINYGNQSHMSRKKFEDLLKSLKLGGQHDVHVHEDEHKRNRRSFNNKTFPQKCLSANQILQIYGVEENKLITPTKFQDICPALIHQLQSEVCSSNPEKQNGNSKEKGDNSWKPWIGAIIANLIITLGSLCGIFAAPLCKKPYFNYILMFLICLAISTLIGDAIMHLLPHSLSIHKHEEGGHDHGDENELLKKESFLWKVMLVLFGVYLFFNFEIFMHAFGGKHSHSHSGDSSHDIVSLEETHKHAGPMDSATSETVKGVLQMNEDAINPYLNCSESSKIVQGFAGMHQCQDSPRLTQTQIPYEEVQLMKNDVGNNQEENLSSEPSITSSVIDSEQQFIKNKKFKYDHFKSVVWMVLIGDGIHNFMDGIAIGVAFTEPWPSGLHGGISTSLAILCHELPHELGDFAILISSGMTVRQALIMNFISSLTSFVGVILGVVLGTQWDAVPWLFAITCGLFIYIALVDMLPEMIHNSLLKKNPVLCILLQNFGLLTGFLFMFLLSAWEENIKTMLS